MLTDYTTYNDLRAALGVSSTDLPDEVLSLNLYELILKQEFEAIDLTLESTYIMTEALTTPTAAAASARRRLWASRRVAGSRWR